MRTEEYRKSYAKLQNDTDQARDLNFLGCYYRKNNQINKKGFFHLFHGDKEKEIDFLRSPVEIAEDNQAIYEFLQNAVDADSSEFYIFWDKENFLVINNGQKFNEKDISSILNFSQSTKSENEKNQIGKFGIGFKLIHRLVGKDNGLDEIINEYKGPILFSWDNKYIEKLIKNDLSDIDKHWLFKILYTNFPCGLDEKIRNKEYKEEIFFNKKDYNNMINFVKKQNLNLSALDRGSLFYLKLGEGKSNLLDEELDTLKDGIKYSLNIINEFSKKKDNRLKYLSINNLEIIPEKLKSITENNYIFLYPKNIKESIDFYEKNSNEKISFFKFFPMGDQKNGLNFILHSSEFDIESNRRKLHETDINKKLLKSISLNLQEQFKNIKLTNPKEYSTILANLYFSDLETANNDKLIQTNLTKCLLSYIEKNIPYLNQNNELQTTSNKSNIVIVDSDLNKIPLEKYCYFYFNPKNHKEIVKEAVLKLRIQRFNIVDVLLNDNIEEWIFNLNEKDFEIFLKELSRYKKSTMLIINKFQNQYTLRKILKVLQIFDTIKNPNFAIIKTNNKYEVSTQVTNTYIKNQDLKDFLMDTDSLAQYNIYLIPDKLEQQILKITKKEPNDNNIIKRLLDNNKHEELISFITTKELKEYFLQSLKRIYFDTTLKHDNGSFELKVLDMMLEYPENLEKFKNKIYINNKLTDNLSKSPFITFKYGTRVINPNSWDNDQNDKNISEFIESLDLKYKNIFNIKEESKDAVYANIKSDIKSNYRLNNQINTKNRLKFIIFYSLEEEKNFISEFNGIDIFDRNRYEDISFETLYKILSQNITLKDEKQLEIFHISDFFPDRLNKDYYINNNNFAIETEKIPSELNQRYIDTFKKIGLHIDNKIVEIRKLILDHKELNSDDLISLTQEQKKNTIQFLSEQNFEFKFETIDYDNLAKLFKSMDKELKENLEYYPFLQNASTIHFIKSIRFYSKKYIDKTHFNNKNISFQERLIKEIEDKKVIFIDILNFDTIPSNWHLIEETENEKKEVEKQKINKEIVEIDSKMTQTSDYNERTAQIGRKGELYVKHILNKKFGPDRVIDNNANGEKQKIDFEVLDENLNEIIHKIEVKATVKNSNSNKIDDLAFYMSPRQYKNAQKYGKDTHLIFVTGVEDDKPEFLYMNFDNSWID